MRTSQLLLCLILATTLVARAQPSSEVIPLPWTSWQFHSGNDPRCVSPDGHGCAVFPGLDPALEEAPASAEEWHRLLVTLPLNLRSPQSLGLLLEDESEPYEVFVNGTLIGKVGDLPRHSGPYNSRVVLPFASALASSGGQIVIAVHAFTMGGNDVHNFTPMLGTFEAVRAQRAENTLSYLHANWQHYLCFFAVFCIGAFCLLFFALDHSSTEYLWLGLLFCGIGYLRFVELAGMIDIGISMSLANGTFYLVEFLLSIFAIEFSFALMRQRVWPVFRVLQVASLTMLWSELPFLPVPLATLNRLSHVTAFFASLFTILLILNSPAFLIPIPLCFRSRMPEMRWIGAALLFLFFEDLNRWLFAASLNGLPKLPSIPQQLVFGSSILDLRALAYMVLALVMLVAMTVRFRRMQFRNRQIESDLEAARTVQRLLIPPTSPQTSDFAIESVYIPAQEVGGDFFHVATAADGSVLVVIGDVSGKGLSAAMTVSTIVGALRAEPLRDPAEVLANLNTTLYGFISGFATCCVALITANRQLTLANAGHLNPYRNGVELTVAGELPLGLTSSPEYTSSRFALQSGDRLTFVSDGVVEAASRKGELFGFDRTSDISTQSAKQIAETAQNFSNGLPQGDDITVLTLDCLAPCISSARS